MKKFSYLLSFAFMFLLVACHPIPDVSGHEFGFEALKKGWQDVSITLSSENKDSVSVEDFLKAFNDEWKIQPADSILAHIEKAKQSPDSTVFTDAGYVSIADNAISLNNETETEINIGSLESAVLPRSNNHQLFYVFVSQPADSIVESVICFYDFNPATSTLTPEENPVSQFRPSWKSSSLFASSSPDNGIFLYESLPYSGMVAFIHYFEYDGNKYDFFYTEMGGMIHLYEQYTKEVGDWKDFTHYALGDINDDGIPEVFISEEEQIDESAIFIISDGELKPLIAVAKALGINPADAKRLKLEWHAMRPLSGDEIGEESFWEEEYLDISELPSTAQRMDNFFQTALFFNVEEETPDAKIVSIWLSDERSGTVSKLCVTNPSAKPRWEELATKKEGVEVGVNEIAVAEQGWLFPGDCSKIIVQGCPDARNIWTYLIDTEAQTVMQLPGSEGVQGFDSQKEEIHIADYGYYPKGGRYSVVKAYSLEGKYLRDLTEPISN